MRVLLQPNDIAPSCGGILAPEVMLDGIGKDIGLALAALLRILLAAQYDCLAAIDLVDAVDDGIKAFHLLELFCIIVEVEP